MTRTKLRCHNDARTLVELDWSVLGLAVAQLFALKEQVERREKQAATKATAAPSAVAQPEYTPLKRSLAQCLRALRASLRQLGQRSQPDQNLNERLGDAVTDDYVRTKSKRARYQPPNPDKKPLGNPNTRPLTPDERRKLDTLNLDLAV